MKVQEIMSSEVHSCGPEADLAMAAMQMWEGDLGVLPVLEGGRVVGMITDRDICMATAIQHREPGMIRVEEVMSGKVYGCAPNADIHQALTVMQQRRVRRLPVMEAETGKLVGVLSLNDVALHATPNGYGELTATDVEETLKALCTHPTYALGRPLTPQPELVTA